MYLIQISILFDELISYEIENSAAPFNNYHLTVGCPKN